MVAQHDLVLKRSLNTGPMDTTPSQRYRTALTSAQYYLASHAKSKKRNTPNEGKGATQVWFMKSMDEGETWTEPIDITHSVGNIALGPGIGINLKSGSLVAPVYDGVIFSNDHGKTWQAGNKTTGPVNESQVVELTDGSLMLNTRGYPANKCKYQCI